MVTSQAIETFTLASSKSAAPTTNRHSQAVEAASVLRHWFGVDFTIIDADTAGVLYLGADQPCQDWAYRAELCQEIARRGKAEFIEEEFPLLLLAVPVPRHDGLVGVAAFLSRHLETEADFSRAASFLRCRLDDARRWAYRQSIASADMLQRIAQLVQGRMEAEQRIETLESEVEQLSLHVASTYEEISLIYRLTQNLRINAKEAELGRAALEWIGEIMPFEGLALQLLPTDNERHANNEAADSPPCLITYGRCPLDNNAFTQMVHELGVDLKGQPLVINRCEEAPGQWRHPQIRQLILLPISETQHVFGYLAAMNHSQQREFGTAEADLLSSVAAILGIHSGNAELYRQQAELLSGIVRALTAAIDAKDPYTCGHSDRVARVSVRLAQEMGLSPQTLETVHLAGLLHDVGKIGVDDGVLRKPGKLTDAEFAHIQSHVRIGHNILVDLKQLDKVLPVVLHHHEAWDGTGYPDGLAGEQIPDLARIVAVADAFDAMSSDRPYRRGMPDDKLDVIIRRGAGSQWDARVVEAFFAARDDIREIVQRDSGDGSFDARQYL